MDRVGLAFPPAGSRVIFLEDESHHYQQRVRRNEHVSTHDAAELGSVSGSCLLRLTPPVLFSIPFLQPQHPVTPRQACHLLQ